MVGWSHILPFSVNKLDVGNIPDFVACNVDASGRVMIGPIVALPLSRHFSSSSLMKCEVAPLSPFATIIPVGGA